MGKSKEWAGRAQAAILHGVVKESLMGKAGASPVCAGNSKEAGLAAAQGPGEEIGLEGSGQQAGRDLVEPCKDLGFSMHAVGTLGGLGPQG